MRCFRQSRADLQVSRSRFEAMIERKSFPEAEFLYTLCLA